MKRSEVKRETLTRGKLVSEPDTTHYAIMYPPEKKFTILFVTMKKALLFSLSVRLFTTHSHNKKDKTIRIN